jgi:hypothetical protein
MPLADIVKPRLEMHVNKYPMQYSGARDVYHLLFASVVHDL